MKVKIWIDNEKWIRADLIKKNNQLGRNLYLARVKGLWSESFEIVKDRIIFDHSNQKIEFIY